LRLIFNPLKEIVHKQERKVENHEQRICKQFIQINTLERTAKEQSLAIEEHQGRLVGAKVMQITDIIPTPYFSQSLLLSGWQSISAVWI
jgi:hypothetical protein